MPSKKVEKEDEKKDDAVVKNVDFNEIVNKKDKKEKKKSIKKEDTSDSENSEDDDEFEIEEDDDVNDDDDDDDDDDEAETLTDVGLFHVLRNFLTDEDGENIGTSMSNIAKELSKLNHNLKKFLQNSDKKK